jgi:hypothetical protein
MDLEPRTSAPAHATGAVQFVDLASLSDDATFRLRQDGDVSALAASLGRLGQMVPVELRPLPGDPVQPPVYQVVAGFRRVAALRLLRRERALARVHDQLSDEDAWGLALSLALLTEPIDRDALEALRARLAHEGAAPWAEELVDEGLVRAPVDSAMRERFLEFLKATPAEAPASAEEGGAEASEEEAEAEAEAEASVEEAEAEAFAEEAEAETVEVTPEELAADLTARLYEVNQDLALAAESWHDLPAEGRRDILDQARWIAGLLDRLEGRDR